MPHSVRGATQSFRRTGCPLEAAAIGGFGRLMIMGAAAKGLMKERAVFSRLWLERSMSNNIRRENSFGFFPATRPMCLKVKAHCVSHIAA